MSVLVDTNSREMDKYAVDKQAYNQLELHQIPKDYTAIWLVKFNVGSVPNRAVQEILIYVCTLLHTYSSI